MVEFKAKSAAEMRKLAEAATPGPWLIRTLENFGWNVVHYRGGDKFDLERVAKAGDEQNAAFIAAANPAQIIHDADLILSLTKEVETLRGALATARAYLPAVADCVDVYPMDEVAAAEDAIRAIDRALSTSGRAS